jgi:hypothetical protein
MEQGIIYYPDGRETEVKPAKGKKFSLAELQAAVGGYIERILLVPGNGHATMYGDEDGKCKGLPVNQKASSMALATRQMNDYVVGPVIVVRKAKGGK